MKKYSYDWWMEQEKGDYEKYRKTYSDWMCDPDNLGNCESCPEQTSRSLCCQGRQHCGQQNCWVAAHCGMLG